MTKFGQVTDFQSATGMATIVFDRPDACAKCGACGAGTQSGSIILKAQCNVGDWVRVEMPEGRFLTATAITYVVPLVGLLLGLGLGWFASNGSDGFTLLGAMVGLGISAVILYLVDRRVSQKPEWTPRITEVFSDRPTGEDIGCHIE